MRLAMDHCYLKDRNFKFSNCLSSVDSDESRFRVLGVSEEMVAMIIVMTLVDQGSVNYMPWYGHYILCDLVGIFITIAVKAAAIIYGW